MAASQTNEFAVFTTIAYLDKLCCKSPVKLDEVLFPSQILVLRAFFPSFLIHKERSLWYSMCQKAQIVKSAFGGDQS